MPVFLTEELKDYIESLYGVDEDDRIFPISKSYLHHEMDRGCAATGVKKIRIHDIRHSHVSLLIDMGFSAVAIANRVGHESIDITYRYAYVFPSTQMEVVSKLNNIMAYLLAALKNRTFYGTIHYRWALARPKRPCGRDSMRFLFC